MCDNENEEEYFDEEDDIFDDDNWREKEEDRIEKCHCGAYKFVAGKGFIHVADCVC